jgi:hypothetical protein
MARMNWDKAKRAQDWQQHVRNSWSGHVPSSIKLPTQKQINYLQSLLEKRGRRRFTEEELGFLTAASASRMIEELRAP